MLKKILLSILAVFEGEFIVFIVWALLTVFGAFFDIEIVQNPLIGLLLIIASFGVPFYLVYLAWVKK